MSLVSDFDFDLPEVCIARNPLDARDASRMLVIEDSLQDRCIADLCDYVQAGDVWVLNDTKVIPARLTGKRPTGANVELLLLEPLDNGHWQAWGKSNKPLKPNDTIIFGDDFSATVIAKNGKHIEVRLQAPDIHAAIAAHGHIPLPPYIHRLDTEQDKQRYQTVFARHEGAVAAPTAGLHLTHKLMQAMQERGASLVYVTLHVGPGTFQPVQVDHIHEHQMHAERYIVSEESAARINQSRQAGHRIIAVGTTSLRTLESATDADGIMHAGEGRTDIFIHPGYHFRCVDGLLTNFHLPRSTLLMLVSALAGRDNILSAYEYAKEHGYRFYSYGDAMLIPQRKELA